MKVQAPQGVPGSLVQRRLLRRLLRLGATCLIGASGRLLPAGTGQGARGRCPETGQGVVLGPRTSEACCPRPPAPGPRPRSRSSHLSSPRAFQKSSCITCKWRVSKIKSGRPGRAFTHPPHALPLASVRGAGYCGLYLARGAGRGVRQQLGSPRTPRSRAVKGGSRFSRKMQTLFK